MKCKYCDNEGTYYCGFLDRNSEWHNKEPVCKEHLDIALGNSRVLASQDYTMQALELHSKLFSKGIFVDVKLDK